MELLIEVIWALALAAVPIGLFTLAIVWWVMRNGHLQEARDGKAIGVGLKALSKKKVKGEEDNRDLLQKKWAKFGGGFYGIVAFFTYIVVEVTEVATMIMNFGGLWAFIKNLGIDTLVTVFVEAIKNFVTAMVWPVYWMEHIDTKQTWIWFVAAYAGYWLGLRLARQLNQHFRTHE